MAVMPLVFEINKADVSKLISLGNLLVRKVTWLVLTTTSVTLILSRAFGADCMTRIAYIYSRIPRTHSLTLWLTETAHTHTLSLLHFDFQQSTPRKCIHSANFFFPLQHFWLDYLQPRTEPQKFRQTPKETNNQHGEETCLLAHVAIFLYIDTLQNKRYFTFYLLKKCMYLPNPSVISMMWRKIFKKCNDQFGLRVFVL